MDIKKARETLGWWITLCREWQFLDDTSEEMSHTVPEEIPVKVFNAINALLNDHQKLNELLLKEIDDNNILQRLANEAIALNREQLRIRDELIEQRDKLITNIEGSITRMEKLWNIPKK